RIEGRQITEMPKDGLAMNILTRLAADAEGIDVEEQARLALENIEKQPHFTRLVLMDEAKETQVDPADIGSGITQVIPVIVAAMDHTASLTVVEQPELHMHPAVQCSLGDVFIREINRSEDQMF